MFKSLYVDDLITGAPTMPAAKQLKCEGTDIFADVKFELHKWHSNEHELETNCENYEPSSPNSNLAAHPRLGKASFLEFLGTKAKTP